MGATGAVGAHVLKQALDNPQVRFVFAPTRKPLTPHPKLSNPVTDFKTIDPQAGWLQTDAIVCALGTTIKDAGSKQEFARVDRDLVLKIAKLAKDKGVERFALNSSIGASLGKNFYLRTKFETEQGIEGLGFKSVTIVRPSIIDTKRKKPRVIESLALKFAKIFKSLIPVSYRPVPAERIARTLLAGVIDHRPGVHVIESEKI